MLSPSGLPLLIHIVKDVLQNKTVIFSMDHGMKYLFTVFTVTNKSGITGRSVSNNNASVDNNAVKTEKS